MTAMQIATSAAGRSGATRRMLTEVP